MSPQLYNLRMIRNGGNFCHTLEYVGSSETVAIQDRHGEENMPDLKRF